MEQNIFTEESKDNHNHLTKHSNLLSFQYKTVIITNHHFHGLLKF